MLQKLRSHPVIANVTKYEQRLRGPVEQLKAAAQLIDGSHLHINEVWVEGKLEKYAYYWLTPTNDVIRGWDNAPHHPEVNSYPYHVHQSSGVHPSQVRSLNKALNFLSQQLIPKKK